MLVVASAVFLPGRSGPFVFDDLSNLLHNTYVKVSSLDFTSLWQAAYSLSAGPLQRPVAMLSFALNYYYATDGFNSALPYKLTNIFLHALNGILVFVLAQQLFRRLFAMRRVGPGIAGASEPRWPALVVALAWLVHPIQLTSVLYVVQRMTELAALFSLSCLIAYIAARNCLLAGHTRRAAMLLATAFGVLWPLALLSKETALLVPCFLLVIEMTLFADENPWKAWHHLSGTIRRWIVAGIVLFVALLLAAGFLYALPGYEGRPFTLLERALTQPRVLFFYLSLLLVPRINAFGLHHDDLAISTSLFEPWTTLPAVLGILALAGVAWVSRRQYPWLSLGIAWFLVGHALESTIFPLEIAHEHRNYFPSFGIVFTCVCAVHFLGNRTSFGLRTLGTVAAIAVLAAVTMLRASQWSSEEVLYTFEAEHHPNSANAQAAYANVLLTQGHYKQSLEAIRRASTLAPHEAAFLISAQIVGASRGHAPSSLDHEEILDRLRRWPVTSTTLWAFSDANDCITDKCKSLQPYLEAWLRTVLQNERTKDPSVFYFFLGRTLFALGRFNEAVDAYRRSYEMDPRYFHPLFDLASLYLALQRPDYAGVILEELRRLNQRSPHKRDREIRELEQRIAAAQVVESKKE